MVFFIPSSVGYNFNQDKSGRLAALGLCFGETTKEEISHTNKRKKEKLLKFDFCI